MGYLDDYTKIPIEEFKGLYKRGMADQVPIDHAICCENVVFSNSGQWGIRPGTKSSYALNHPVKRIFEGSTDSGLHIFTMDWNGNLYPVFVVICDFTFLECLLFYILSGERVQEVGYSLHVFRCEVQDVERLPVLLSRCKHCHWFISRCG